MTEGLKNVQPVHGQLSLDQSNISSQCHTFLVTLYPFNPHLYVFADYFETEINTAGAHGVNCLQPWCRIPTIQSHHKASKNKAIRASKLPCGQCCGSASIIIRIRIQDPKNVHMDPDPDPRG